MESYSWLDSINPFTADQLEELKANPGWQPERYGHTADELRPTFEQILRRCNRDMWKRYRDNAKAARKAEADFRVPMPTGTPGPKQNVELAARIKGFVAEGKSSEQIRQILEGEKVNLEKLIRYRKADLDSWIEARLSESSGHSEPKGGVDVGPYTVKIPNRFFGSGMAARLGCSASLVYLALWDHANRNSNTFKASDRALASDTGLGTRTICNVVSGSANAALSRSRARRGRAIPTRCTGPLSNGFPLRKDSGQSESPGRFTRSEQRYRSKSCASVLRIVCRPLMQALLIPRVNFADPAKCFHEGEEEKVLSRSKRCSVQAHRAQKDFDKLTC